MSGAAAADDGRLVKELRIVDMNDQDGPSRIVKMSQPTGEFSRRLERVMGGLLMNLHEDAIIIEIGMDGEPLE